MKAAQPLAVTTTAPAPASSSWFNPEADKSLTYDLDKAKFYLKKSKYAEGASFELMSTAVPYLLDSKDCVVFLGSVNQHGTGQVGKDLVQFPLMLLFVPLLLLFLLIYVIRSLVRRSYVPYPMPPPPPPMPPVR